MDKCGEHHCGLHNQQRAYIFGDSALKTMDEFIDLGVAKGKDSVYSQPVCVVAKAARVMS